VDGAVAEASEELVERGGAEVIQHHDEQQLRQRPHQRRVAVKPGAQILAAGELPHRAAEAEEKSDPIGAGRNLERAHRSAQKIAAPAGRLKRQKID